MIYVIIHLIKPIECITPRVKSKVNYRLWVIMMCQCRVILGLKKSAVLVSDVDNGRGYTCVGTGIYEKSLYFSLIFVVNIILLYKKWNLKIVFLAIYFLHSLHSEFLMVLSPYWKEKGQEQIHWNYLKPASQCQPNQHSGCFPTTIEWHSNRLQNNWFRLIFRNCINT